MAQDVGPVLELVTERYLLRLTDAQRARADAGRLFEELLDALRAGDVAAVGRLTHANFHFPRRLCRHVRQRIR